MDVCEIVALWEGCASPAAVVTTVGVLSNPGPGLVEALLPFEESLWLLTTASSVCVAGGTVVKVVAVAVTSAGLRVGVVS